MYIYSLKCCQISLQICYSCSRFDPKWLSSYYSTLLSTLGVIRVVLMLLLWWRGGQFGLRTLSVFSCFLAIWPFGHLCSSAWSQLFLISPCLSFSYWSTRVFFLFLLNSPFIDFAWYRGNSFSFFIFYHIMWFAKILVPQPGTEPRPMADKVEVPHCWTAREFPARVLYKSWILILHWSYRL